MHKSSIAVAALLLCTAPSFAGDEVMTSYFGNTVVTKSAMGESHMHYKADHTFDVSIMGMGISHATTGTWKIDDKSQLCRTYAQVPPGMPNPLCTPWAAHKIGDSWKAIVNGSTRDLSLVKGIQ